MMKLDPYAELGIERDASEREVRAAAKRHAKKNHPDAGGDRNRFEAGRRALVVLADPKKREKFDRTGDVEEDKVDNDLAAAMQIIIAEVAGIINNYISKNMHPQWDPRRIKVFEQMKFALGAKIAEGAASVAKAERQLAFLRDFADRISTKKKKGMPEIDFVKRALEEQIRGFEHGIEDAKLEQRRHQIAIDLLAIYDFRADLPPPQNFAAGMPNITVTLW